MFKAIIVKNKYKAKVNSNFCKENVNITGTVKLLGIQTDKDQTCDTHIAKLYAKSAAQLSAITAKLRFFELSRDRENSSKNQGIQIKRMDQLKDTYYTCCTFLSKNIHYTETIIFA